MDQNETKKINEKFEKAHPLDILEWAIQSFDDGVVLSSSFGAESAGLIHMATQIKPAIPVVFLNTGFLFKETLQFRDDLKSRFHLNLREFNASPDEISETKKKLNDPENKIGFCCDNVKVRLMQDALKNVRCWIAGLRRNQSSTRKNINIVEQFGNGLVKVHPLANWTSKELFQYMTQHNLPFHPLWEKGYKSIGCEPCTSLPLSNQDDRSGRWAGTDKTECGIHTFLPEKEK